MRISQDLDFELARSSEGDFDVGLPRDDRTDDDGTLLVSFVDIPEAHTFADDEEQIAARATDFA